jgi:hypothetical protein
MASAAGPIVSNLETGNGAGQPQPLAEESIEFLQREIELLKRRIVEERQKLCDKTIVQVTIFFSISDDVDK